jgi:hypothetical protein
MTIDFIPLEYYMLLYYNLLLVVVFFTWVNSKITQLTDKKNLHRKGFLGLVLLIFIVLFMGLRPISGAYFGDMRTYANLFENYASGGSMLFQQDVGFDFFMSFCAKVMTVEFFFLFCSFIYVYPSYLASKKLFKEYWFYSFLMLVGSFSYWTYGTNGIRNGLGTSFVLLALAYSDKKVIMIALMFVAASFHKTMLLPIVAYVITIFYNDNKNIFYFWLLCIPFSLVAGGAFESAFASFGFGDERISYLTEGNVNNDDFSSTGFRWDFLIYSASAVYAGWYFIFKRKYKDPIYLQLFNIYLICNGFWILVIRANFSNRFAYLSWFMMGLVIIYPFLKQQFFRNQHKVLGTVIALYFMFTYIMNH